MSNFDELFEKYNSKKDNHRGAPSGPEPMLYESVFPWEESDPFDESSTDQETKLNISLSDFINAKSLSLFLGVFLTASAIGYWASQSITPRYSSSRQYYVPDKSEDFSSRLANLSNRLNFVSLPARWQIPTRLLSRKISDDQSKNVVVRRLNSKNNVNGNPINSESIYVSPYYSMGEQVLLIQGFADNPEVAAQATNLYGELLEEKLNGMWEEYQSELLDWIRNAKEVLNEESTKLSTRLKEVKLGGAVGLSNSVVPSSLSKRKNDLELSVVQSKSELKHLRHMLRESNIEGLSGSFLPEIQSYVEMHNKLKGMVENSSSTDQDLHKIYQGKLKSIEKEAFEFIRSKYTEVKGSLTAFRTELRDIDRRLKRQYSGSQKPVVAHDEKGLEQQVRQSQADLKEIGALENQILVNDLMTQRHLVLLQKASANPASRTPSTIVMMFVLVLGSLAIASVLSFLQVFIRKLKLRSKRVELDLPRKSNNKSNSKTQKVAESDLPITASHQHRNTTVDAGDQNLGV